MISNLTRQTTLARRVVIAEDSSARMKGLLGRLNLEPDEALVITHCQSIHMFFMKFAIDVIFCDKDNKVIGLCANIKPWQLSPIFFKASLAIELPTGTIALTKTQLQDQITIRV